MTIPNHSTPIGLAPADVMCAQDCVQAPSANALPAGLAGLVATAFSFTTRASQPPTLSRPSHTSGRNPNTIMKNCSTSL